MGFGVGDLAAHVEGLTGEPLTVLVTHGHLDHAFGAGWFDDVYRSQADLSLLDAQVAWLAPIQEEAMNEGRVVAPSLLKDSSKTPSSILVPSPCAPSHSRVTLRECTSCSSYCGALRVADAAHRLRAKPS